MAGLINYERVTVETTEHTLPMRQTAALVDIAHSLALILKYLERKGM